MHEHQRLPSPLFADENGIVCVGASPEPDLLIEAYSKGIFPWPHEGLPLLWFSPDPRFVITWDSFRISKSLRKSLRKTTLRIEFDTCFESVIEKCSKVLRPGQDGTWITSAMTKGYTKLHEHGYAHSAEAFMGKDLVGGLYGISTGPYFCGESMFATRSDASKVAFVVLAAHLKTWGYHFIDCQVHTEHLERFGGFEMKREFFLELLETAQNAADDMSWQAQGWRSSLEPKQCLEVLCDV